MDLIIPFAYTEEEIPPRKRKPRPVKHDDGVLTVTIPELTDQEAPIAGILHEKGYIGNERQMLAPMPYRWYEGKLWSPRDVEDMREAKWYLLPSVSENHYGIPGTDWMSRAEREEKIREWAKGFIIVDGQTYKPCPLPYYELYVDTYKGKTELVFLVRHDWKPIERSHRAIPVTDYNRLFSKYTAILDAYPDLISQEGPESPNAERVEVFLPEALSFTPYERREYHVQVTFDLTLSLNNISLDLNDPVAVQEALLEEAKTETYPRTPANLTVLDKQI